MTIEWYKNVQLLNTKTANMLTVSNDMQPLLRDLRALFRQAQVSDVLNAYWTPHGRDVFKRMALWVARLYTIRGSRHRFALSKIKHILKWALYSVERQQHPVPFFLKYEDEMTKLLCLMNGELYTHSPDPCCICLGRRGGWWRSTKCGHCFHAKCISTHFAHDGRCPLCRVVIY
jgi:hypothetical protein